MNRYTQIFELSKNEKKESKLCNYGFFITNSNIEVTESLPYITTWNKIFLDNFTFYIHPNQKIYTKSYENDHYFLIGHAYNPFDGITNEEELLEKLHINDCKGKECAIDYINSFTGIFLLGKIDSSSITVLLDCAGMCSGFYGIVDNNIIITSHTAIPAALFNLEVSQYAKSLFNYKFYPLYGSFLPGDTTQYKYLKRIVPNTMVSICKNTLKFDILRFYPISPLEMAETEEEYQCKVDSISEIMKKTMFLITKKWKKPAISLTGGMDSKTTLAASKGLEKNFSYYSYVTSKAEKLDASAAHKICNTLNLPHTIYSISPCPSDYEDYNITKKILLHNKDYIGKNNTNDVCKRIFLDNISDFDIEIKSWVSEIARANYYKKFGKRKMPKKITARRCSCLYKIFLHNRTLLHKTDKIFSEYIVKTDLINHIFNFDWSDLFLWEIRYGSWGGLVISSEHKYSSDITIPYNNRKLLELMISTPLEKRKKDILHNDLIKKMNISIFDTGINVINLNETKFREIMEKIYFNINSILPF